MKTILRRIDCLNIDVEFQVGQNAQENHDIIDDAEPSDLWFHLAGLASCHVIGKIPEKVVIDKSQLLKIVKQGAVICKQCSSLKSQTKVEVEWTHIENVTKLDKPGSVSVTNVRKIII
jgi:predicted ribosome quality control (RQC) complex YloA/Tae2 family protein